MMDVWVVLAVVGSAVVGCLVLGAWAACAAAAESDRHAARVQERTR